MTFLSIDIDHGRFLYDQFAILSPLFLALSAGSPIFKGINKLMPMLSGKLANTDTKWNCLE
jgi:glutamate--cysteine ligase catalytic subunit